MIADSLQKVKQEIQDSCAPIHHDPKEVALVAVTKSVESAQAEELVRAGVMNCTENRVDKLLQKKQDLFDFPEIKWCLTGNLQRRRVKLIVNEIDYFHALGGLRLAKEIQKRLEERLSCFIEVNISGEESKHGISPSEFLPFVESLIACTKIKVIGLMTMAPKEASDEQIHKVFDTLKELRGLVQARGYAYAPYNELSMGMSQDFQIVIGEGATFIRVGTALFKGGQRRDKNVAFKQGNNC